MNDSKKIFEYILAVLKWRRHEWDMEDRTQMTQYAIEIEMRFEEKDKTAIKHIEAMLNQEETDE